MAEDINEKLILEVSPSNFLVLIDKSRIKSLIELADALKMMPDDVFGYHVNFQKNDFSDWIKSAVGAKKLAEDIFNAESKHEMARLIEIRISGIKNREDIIRSVMKERERILNEIQGEKREEQPKEEEKERERLMLLGEEQKKKKIEEKKRAKEDRLRQTEEKRKKQEKEKRIKKELKEAKKREKKQKFSEKVQKNPKKSFVEAEVKKKQNNTREVLAKENEILEKERGIEFREKKILEIEEHIEERLNEAAKKGKDVFFSKDFIQGIIVGILLVVLVLAVYWKFFLV